MPSLRQKFKISWDDGPMVDVQTTARDMVNAADFGENPALATFALIHAALIRLGHTVPPLDEWLDLVDEVEEGPTVVADVPGPTPAAPSVGEPLPSPSLPGLTGEAGLPDLTTGLSPLLRQSSAS